VSHLVPNLFYIVWQIASTGVADIWPPMFLLSAFGATVE
jgi:hypothetical protein